MSDQPGGSAPTLVSLVICDQVIDDRLTNKKSAIGLFNTIVVPAVPTRVPQLTVMATLTEIHERTPADLRLIRDSDNEILIRSKGFLAAPDPLSMVDLVFAMHGVQFQLVGQYAFELHAAGQLLGRRRFQVVAGPPRPQQPRPRAENPENN